MLVPGKMLWPARARSLTREGGGTLAAVPAASPQQLRSSPQQTALRSRGPGSDSLPCCGSRAASSSHHHAPITVPERIAARSSHLHRPVQPATAPAWTEPSGRLSPPQLQPEDGKGLRGLGAEARGRDTRAGWHPCVLPVKLSRMSRSLMQARVH